MATVQTDGIAFQHPMYKKYQPTWQKINDLCDGENLDDYLIYLNPADLSPANQIRNRQYRDRAVFYAIAGYTARGLNGLLFSKTPKLEVPPALEYLKEDADGAGNSIYQQSQYVGRDLERNGRCGLAVTFPQIKEGEEVSQADITAGVSLPTIHHVRPEQIINWRGMRAGSKYKLSLIVISESEEVIQDDGYTILNKPILRELGLQDGVYFERIWNKNDKGKWLAVSEVFPKTGGNKAWAEIPFTFAGAENNDASVDQPPMLDIIRVNEGHFRNSAEWEDAVFYGPGNQAWMSGISQTHIDLMKDNNMYVGGPYLIGVPSGEQFGYASGSPNPLPRQAMIDKIDQAIGMGARFIQPSGPARSATEAAGDQQVQHSVLSLISENLGDAYTRCLRWCGEYLNIDASTAVYETTKDFVAPNATAQDIQAIVAGWMQGAVPMSDMIAWLQKRNIIDPKKTEEEVLEELAGATGAMPDLDAGI